MGTDYSFNQFYEYVLIFSHDIFGLFLLELILWIFENGNKMENSANQSSSQRLSVNWKNNLEILKETFFHRIR